MAPSISLTTDERRTFNHLYSLADKEDLGVLTGDKAIVFFEGTQLPGQVLGEIWQLSDSEDTGFLTKEQFYIACRLIGHAQAGATPSEALFTKPGPLPWFKGITIPGLSRQPQQPLSASQSGGRSSAPGTPSRQASVTLAQPAPTSSPAPSTPSRTTNTPVARSGQLTISPEDRAKYTRIFYNAGPVAGLLDGDKASEILKKSKLPDDKLGQIWNLADTQSRGFLDAGDFVIAMALIQGTMNGSLASLPDELPDTVYGQAGASKPGMAAAPASALPLAGMQVPGSPLRSQYTGQQAQPARANSLAQPFGAGAGAASAQGTVAWAITPLEKSQSDTFFNMLDTTRQGAIAGETAGPFFMQSGLSGDILASIWDLSDIKNDGMLDRDEFALARRLVMDALTGKPVPERLDEAFVPPSLRSVWKSTAAQQPSQQSEVQRDLFSLMDDDEEPTQSLPAPAAAAAASAFTSAPAPLQPIATGGSGARVSFAPAASPIEPAPTGGSIRSATSNAGLSAARSAQAPPVPAARSALASPPVTASRNDDFFDATPVEEEPPQISDRSAEVGNLQNQVSQTQRSVSKLRDQRVKLQDQVNKVEEQINELQVSLSQAKAAYDVENTNMSNLEARQKKGAEELKTLREETIHAQSELSGLREQKAELEQTILRDKEEIRDLRAKMKTTNDEVAALKEQLEKLKKDARQQKGMVVVSKKQLATSEAEREKVERGIAEEREAASRAPAEPAPHVPAVVAPTSLPSGHLEEAKGVPLPESGRPSPAPSTTSTRSKNPFDRAGGAAALGLAAGGAAGLAAPAIAHAAKSRSPLHDGFGASQDSQAFDAPATDAEQDPFGMSPFQPQQMSATHQQSAPAQSSGGFGFDDDFSSAFDAPAQPRAVPSQPAPSADFDDAFADFGGATAPSAIPTAVANDAQSGPAEGAPVPIALPLPGRDQPENAPVRAASPTTAERSIAANQPDSQLSLGEERAASPTATAPFSSAAPAGEALVPGANVASEGPLDEELQHRSAVHPPSSAMEPYASREVAGEDDEGDAFADHNAAPDSGRGYDGHRGDVDSDDEDEDGDGDLAPIKDVPQADDDDDEDSDSDYGANTSVAAPATPAIGGQSEGHDSTHQSEMPLHSSSMPVYLAPAAPAAPADETAPLDKGKGREVTGNEIGADDGPLPGAYPSDDEDAFEDAHASMPERSTSPSTNAAFASGQNDAFNPPSHDEPAIANSTSKPTGPTLGFDNGFDSPFNTMTPLSGSSATPARQEDLGGDSTIATSTAPTEQHEGAMAPSAGFAETGMTVAKEAEVPSRAVHDDFDDFEDLAPARIEPETGAGPISATSGGSFEDSFDDDFAGFDSNNNNKKSSTVGVDAPFSHTLTSAGVGKADDVHGSLAQPPAHVQQVSTGTGSSSAFDDDFSDAFAVPSTGGGPAMHVVGSEPVVASSFTGSNNQTTTSTARPPVGFDDDFFTSSAPAAPAQIEPSSTNARSGSVAPQQQEQPQQQQFAASPAPAEQDRSYMYAPPPGSPPRSATSQALPPAAAAAAPAAAPALPQRSAVAGTGYQSQLTSSGGNEDPPQLKELQAMGFGRQQALAALEDNQFDVGRAANVLLAFDQ